MSIRFCEFCSTVHPHETTHCPDCGTPLVQAVSEELFNDPNNPWPFTPISGIQLVIQGKPRCVNFSGTHSVYHLWSQLHKAYENGTLCFSDRGTEMELACHSVEQPVRGAALDPVAIMGCHHSRFSLYNHRDNDPDMAGGDLKWSYQGSFEIVDCPPRFWKDILGWLVATPPHPALDNQWTYFMT